METRLGAAKSVVGDLESQLSKERLARKQNGDRLQTFAGLAAGLGLGSEVVQAIQRAEPRIKARRGVEPGNSSAPKKRNRNAEAVKACITPILHHFAKVISGRNLIRP